MGSTEVVKLYVYDMSNGIASKVTVGCVDAIYHTGVFVFGEEFSYGPQGIKKSPPGSERPNSERPDEIERIGKTSRSIGEFKKFVRELGKSTFRGSNYNVLFNNCNIFSQTLCEFLCGVGIPQYILNVQENAAMNPLAVGVTFSFGQVFKSFSKSK